ncbi:MAG: GspE/PulE family protein [Bdellovibrionales bacterium]
MVDPQTPAPTPRIGEQLLRLGLITPDQIEVALHEKARSGKMLGTILVDLGFIKETDLAAALAARSGAAHFDSVHALIDPALGRTIPREQAERHRIAILSEQGGEIAMAMVDPYDVLALDAARRFVPPGTLLMPQIITPADLSEVHDFIYGYSLSLDDVLRELRTGSGEFTTAELARGFRHPIVRLVNMLMLDAVKQHASDIHFEPEEYFIRIRLRIDGVLQQVAALHKDFWSALSHRLKIMAGMNIADKLMPQDGRFTITLSGRVVDFRVSTLPSAHGENISVRVLDQSNALRSLNELGFTSEALAAITTMLKRPEGLLIVTGPTGSGKTTTLYAALNQLANVKRNIMTLEDPIEYQLPLIRQTQIREATGLGFAEGVRSILRQDPDIILVGEVRDSETAQMALRAAMTGHLVLTTLHTRDILGVMPRLHDLGMTPALMAGNINGLVAQRLVRQLCPHCKKPDALAAETAALLDVPAKSKVFSPVGCAQCRNTGYKGRVPVAEALVIDPTLDELIGRNAPRSEWLKILKARGFKSLREQGIALLLAGTISAESLLESIDVIGMKEAA